MSLKKIRQQVSAYVSANVCHHNVEMQLGNNRGLFKDPDYELLYPVRGLGDDSTPIKVVGLSLVEIFGDENMEVFNNKALANHTLTLLAGAKIAGCSAVSSEFLEMAELSIAVKEVSSPAEILDYIRNNQLKDCYIVSGLPQGIGSEWYETISNMSDRSGIWYLNRDMRLQDYVFVFKDNPDHSIGTVQLEYVTCTPDGDGRYALEMKMKASAYAPADIFRIKKPKSSKRSKRVPR